MQIDPEEIRQRFEQLSDDGLLAIDRDELIELAQQYYDAEVSKRGLETDPGEPEEAVADDELVALTTFNSMEEADLVRALLQSEGISCKLENEFSSDWTGVAVRLMVPTSSLEQAEEILQSQISEDELIAQAEAAEPAESQDD